MSILEEATTMSLLWLSTYDADGVLMFWKTYWKQTFNYEIKLHDGQGDIHKEIYHWHALYYGPVQFLVGFKRSIDRLGIKLNDLDVSTQVALLTFFRTAVLQN